MEIRNEKLLQKAMKKHAAARKPLSEWIRIIEEATWQNIIEARSVLPATDAIKGTNLTCFNIGGNRFRMIAVVSYVMQLVTLHEFLTHAEYSRKYGGR